MVQSILPEFAIPAGNLRAEPYGSGLINATWRVSNGNTEYILQRINQQVFREPRSIAANVRMIADYLQQHYPDYLFVVPIRTNNNDDLAYFEGEGFYRLVPFVKGSHTRDVVSTPGEAYEAANQFGLFAALLSGLDASSLHITIPDFHNLSLRYDQFRQALENGNPVRISEAAVETAFILKNADIVASYNTIVQDAAFKIRVMHHDTKINNVLLDSASKGLCVIDLDTVMPGYFISDVGDMMRTYLSPANEEETDLDRICVREEIFEAIVAGYLKEMKSVLTAQEKKAFVYAGKFMIYMQAIRFLADYFNNDQYYGARYEKHNLNRARNQINLLQKLMDKEEKLLAILEKIIQS